MARENNIINRLTVTEIGIIQDKLAVMWGIFVGEMARKVSVTLLDFEDSRT